MKTPELKDWWREEADETRSAGVEARTRAALLKAAAGRRAARRRRGALAAGGGALLLALAAVWSLSTPAPAPRATISTASVPKSAERVSATLPRVTEAELAEWFPDADVALVRRGTRVEVIVVSRR